MKFQFLFDAPRSPQPERQSITRVAVIRRGIALRASVALALLAVSACGANSNGGATLTTTTPVAERLFAVVESPSGTAQPDTVAIVGLDGIARAKATFQPRVGPVVPDAYTPLQSAAQLVGTGVFYIDGVGTVRVLRVGSQPQIVARFPLQPAQEDIWFAVSPDGSRVVAGILTLPALGPNSPGTSWPTLVGPWKFDLEMAAAGGQTTTLIHSESAYAPDDQNHGWKPMFPVGWTSAGPVVMVPLYVTSQNAWPGGPLYVIDDSGNKIARLGGSDCISAVITSGGLIPCTTAASETVAVRDVAGTVVWASQVDAFGAWSVRVSPDGQGVLNDGQAETRVNGVLPRPGEFRFQGWLDANTVVGRSQSSNGDEGSLTWISVGDPTKVHDLGFKGDFVAMLV